MVSEIDPTVLASVKDGVSWGEVSGIPSGFADGIDNVGTGGDNLGNHTATENIKLNEHYLSGDGGNEGVYVDSAGRVGIGTDTPTHKLEVRDNSSIPAILARNEGSGIGVYGESSGYYGVYGNCDDGYGVYGSSDSGWGVYGSSAGGYGVYGSSGHDIGVYGHSAGAGQAAIKGDASGAVGCGVLGIAKTGTGVRGEGGIYDFYAAGSGINYFPFTGAHEVKLTEDSPADIESGMIVSVTGQTQTRYNKKGQVSVSSTMPTVKLSDVARDKAVFGAFVAEVPLPQDHWYEASEAERFAAVNALGEGRAWVCNINGEIEAGDYITTSTVPGYGQRQDDDLLHSYTLAKAIETVDWDSVTQTVEFKGQSVKVYLIAVVYTSG